MKKNALVAFGLLISLVPTSAVLGKEVSQTTNFTVSKNAGITLEQARKKALEKVPGTVEDEYTIEDEEGTVTTYVFVIKKSDGKKFDVQIDAEKGTVLSAEEQEVYEEDSEGEEPPVALNDVQYNVDNQVVESEEIQATEGQEAVSEEYTVEETYISEDPVNTENTAVEETPPTVTKPAFSIEQARVVALKKVKGDIQSETMIEDQGRPFYSFIIKEKQNKTSEVHVDANSGRAKKPISKTPSSE